MTTDNTANAAKGKEHIASFFKDILSSSDTLFRDMESSARNILEWLAEKGRLPGGDARELLDGLAERTTAHRREWEERIDAFVSERLNFLAPPKRQELTDLRQRVNALIDRLDRLEARWQRRRGEPHP